MVWSESGGATWREQTTTFVHDFVTNVIVIVVGRSGDGSAFVPGACPAAAGIFIVFRSSATVVGVGVLIAVPAIGMCRNMLHGVLNVSLCDVLPRSAAVHGMGLCLVTAVGPTSAADEATCT